MLIDDRRRQHTYTRWIQQWQAQCALASNVLLDGKQLSDQLGTQRQQPQDQTINYHEREQFKCHHRCY